MTYVILQCVRYDRRTYDTLVEAHDRETSRNKPTSTRFHDGPQLAAFPVGSVSRVAHRPRSFPAS